MCLCVCLGHVRSQIAVLNSTVDFEYSGHGYIMATLGGAESFPTISSQDKSPLPLIVATHFR